MEKLRKYCLSSLWLLMACQPETSPDDPERSAAYLDSAQHQYQGSALNMTYLLKAVAADSTNAEAWRELSIPYLKRGYPHEWFRLAEKTIALDPQWTGYRGCNYLQFYRDYERALADFRATDTLTPGFTDYPQAMSIRYLKGLCFFGLQQYDSALFHFQACIDEETARYGPEWVDEEVFLYRAIIHNKTGHPERALYETRQGLQVFGQSADLYYQRALAYYTQERLDSALHSLQRATHYFAMGYYHHIPYTEVQEQLYLTDIKDLETQIVRKMKS